MATMHNKLDPQEVRRRAAEIRRQWSPAERDRRCGLPPDIPPRLRQLIFGSPQLAWSPAFWGAPTKFYSLR